MYSPNQVQTRSKIFRPSDLQSQTLTHLRTGVIYLLAVAGMFQFSVTYIHCYIQKQNMACDSDTIIPCFFRFFHLNIVDVCVGLLWSCLSSHSGPDCGGWAGSGHSSRRRLTGTMYSQSTTSANCHLELQRKPRQPPRYANREATIAVLLYQMI